MRLAVTAVVTALTIGGCSAPQPEYPAIEVGECVESMAEGHVTEITRVPCEEPHDWEAFATMEIPDAKELPPEKELESMAEEFCFEQFREFVGIDVRTSELEIQYMVPTEPSWKVGDRTISCMAGLDGLQATGTLEGTKR